MAATDQHYRNQYGLDVVFAISSALMLVSLIGMFVQDYNREYKHEQRRFRDVESAIAQRLALDQIPPAAEMEAAEKMVLLNKLSAKDLQEEINKVEQGSETRFAKEDLGLLKKHLKGAEEREKELPVLKREIAEKLPAKEEAEVDFQKVSSKLASISSFYNLEVGKNGPNSDLAKYYRGEVVRLTAEKNDAQNKRDDKLAEIKERQRKIDEIEAPLTEALSKLKKVNDKFDTQVKLAITKQWGVGDWVRNLPVIDGFAAPTKIHQFTLNDIPIDYNFKYVTRFDRCMTCHQGIDRPAYTRENLTALRDVTSAQEARLADARKVLEKRKETLKGLAEAKNVAGPDQLKLTKIPESHLSDARIREYAAHPRLDLFVGADSKHPAEKFGCTSCHSGQGSGTAFLLASHTPNDAQTKKLWIEQYHWHYDAHHGDALWDFPMLPTRFVESSCLKCHHEVTDLISSNNRSEAPKLIRGFNLIKENGCFGCHEIHGRKGGRQIGPDLRLESSPPLESLTPAERARIEADPDNMPGNLRKVGPSLFRLSEKTNRAWTAKWLQAPREFRPDTKMPHFYGLANNSAEALKGTGQENFPAAEIDAITHFLFAQSDGYLTQVRESHKADAAARKKDQDRLELLQAKPMLTDADKKDLDTLSTLVKLRSVALLPDSAPKGDKEKGRLLFTERGCMACHSHQGTETVQGSAQKLETYSPAVLGEANFGPNLSQLAAKLIAKPGDDKAETAARAWLVQWILDPHVYSPRSRMPVTHLSTEQAADIAAWLLSQPAADMGTQWKELAVPDVDKLKQDDTFKKLARVYLVRMLSARDIDDLLEGKFPADRVSELPQDEQVLATSKELDVLKLYLGKKAVGRLGCYACHDIRGFDNAKPIGVGLNEWGKKDAQRLAFEDIAAYLRDHYELVDNMRDKDGKPVRRTDKHKPVYEKFFADALQPHKGNREGFLYQKLDEPRSFDYHRILAWDDRARMPQFRFARSKPRIKKMEDGAAVRETSEEHQARADVEEAEAREAVMTFVLGLVAEPVPPRSINQPSGDRLAEIKGRQVLDKFNCAGCHVIRAGAFEFLATAEATKALSATYNINKDTLGYKSDHVFPFHHFWADRTPATDRLLAHGVRARVEADEDNPAARWLKLTLTGALRFRGPDQNYHDIRSASEIKLPADSMLYPPADVARSEEKLQAFERDQGAYGGAFADLLANFLMDQQPKKYDRNPVTKDNGAARASVPPVLIGQGERTQAEWLYQFLLNPQKVRDMTVLRMPRFNMSPEDAKALVNYFAAVERLTNTGLGLTYPYEAIPQRVELTSPFWQGLTSQYVDRLKGSKVKDADGKDKTLFEQRIQELKPVWTQIKADIDRQRDQAKSQHQAALSAWAEAKKAAEAEKDPKKKALLEETMKDLGQGEANWRAELGRLEKEATAHDLDKQQKTWEKEQAYVTDGYRLLANYQLCLACHQVGPLQPNKLDEKGPPLDLAFERLQPGWLLRWLAHPQRHVPYSSVMPVNFPADKENYQQLFAGSALEQVTAIRDVLMIYPRASAMPVNRYWTLPPAGEKK